MGGRAVGWGLQGVVEEREGDNQGNDFGINFGIKFGLNFGINEMQGKIVECIGVRKNGWWVVKYKIISN